MSASRNLLGLLSALFLLNAVFAEAASEAYPLRIKVLTAETHAINAEAQVPKDCDFMNYSAYCNESKNPSSQSIMLVQDGEGKSYRIACTTDSRWSKCAPLPVGETFEAHKDKHGITIVYRDSKGKERKQLYQFLAAAPAPQSGAAADSQPRAAAPVQNSPAPASAPPPASAQGGFPEKPLPEKVRCNFSSTPSGAEITVDGRYVGNTPSEIGLSVGTHVVVFSMTGFVQWKRELTVAADSVVNVTASLQKTQP